MKSIVIEREIAAPMRDGVRLFATLHRPSKGGPFPVIMSVTPYGKDKVPRVTNFLMRLSGIKFGHVNCSRLTGFESLDPVYWTKNGFAVMQADVRGFRKSEGNGGILRRQDAEDYYDLIEWAASQPWCTGRVGLMGVSYLCMSQWRVAELRPPHLRAIVPWEGVTDMYRELAFHGGIPETKFVRFWDMRLKRERNRKFPIQWPYDNSACSSPDAFPAHRDVGQCSFCACLLGDWALVLPSTQFRCLSPHWRESRWLSC